MRALTRYVFRRRLAKAFERNRLARAPAAKEAARREAENLAICPVNALDKLWPSLNDKARKACHAGRDEAYENLFVGVFLFSGDEEERAAQRKQCEKLIDLLQAKVKATD